MSVKISIIIPAYNIENHLAATLESVLAQTHENLEVIVVNDGSTDGTAAVIDAFAARDHRVRAIHKENGGVTSARLRGVAEAGGDWIGFVDGDDFIEPQMYARLLENALEYSVDISHCGYQMVFPQRVDYYYNSGKLLYQDHITGLKDLLEGKFVEPGLWNKLYRKELFAGLTERMDSSIRINEDLLMNYWLFAAAGSAVFEDICPYHYILRKGSAATSRLNEHKLWDPLRVTRIIMDNCPAEAEAVVYRKLIRQLVMGASMSTGSQKELIAPYRREVRRELRQRLFATLRGRQCGVKLKAMALWVSVWPAGYRWIHSLYAKVTGLDKIYDFD